MAQPNPKSGGALLAAAVLLGVLAGVLLGQPSAGFLVGLGVGLAALGAVWLSERRR
jgi:hypothetical protein